MSSLRTKHWSAIVVLVGMLLAFAGFSAPAEAVTARAVSFYANPSAAYAGTPVSFSGHLSKSGKGAVVRVQRKSGSTWVNAKSTTTTTRTGAYKVSLMLPSTPANYVFRARAPKTAKYAAATSRSITVAALRHTTATISATPNPVALGGTATLSGTVSPFVTGTTVTIQRQSNGSWITNSTAVLNSAGAFSQATSPAVTTTYRVAVPRAGLNAGTASAPTTLTVGPAQPAPEITTTTLPDGDKGVAYSTGLSKTGGAGTWSVTGGALPAGITLNPATGVLSGTPTVGGTAHFTITFHETATGLSASKALSLLVTPPPSITTTSLPNATRAVAYTTTLTKTGHDGTWSVASALPGGLSLDSATGVISGTPTQVGDFAVYPTFTETSTGRTAFKALALHINGTALAITTTSLPDGTKGVAYTTTLTQNGGAGTWSSLALPGGLTLNPTTGVLSGTPTVAGDYSVFVGFTETATGTVVSKGFALHLAPSPVVTTTSLPDGTTGSAYSQQLTKTGQAGTWTKASGNLPPGVTLSASGLVSGTPTSAGDYGFTVTFTETSTGYSDNQVLLLHVSDPGAPVINTTSLPNGIVGTLYAGQLSATPAGGTWSVSFGSLPPGITLNSATGALSGTPTTPGDTLFIVKYTTASSNNTKVLSIHVAPA